MNAKQASPPALHIIEHLALCRSPADIVELSADDETLATHAEAFGELVNALDKPNGVRTIWRHLAASDDDRLRVIADYACASVGIDGAADLVAKEYAQIAHMLASWCRVEGWKNESDIDKRTLGKVSLRMRQSSMNALAWSVAAGGLPPMLIYSLKVVDQLNIIAADFETSIWASAEAHGYALGVKRGEGQVETDESDSLPVADIPEGLTCRVLAGVGSAASSGGKESQKALARIIDKPLPLLVASEDQVDAVRKSMLSEYPHAADVVETFLGDLRPGAAIRFRPSVIVGESGGGKSHLSRRLLDLLGIPSTLLDAATTSDQSVVGTPRKWSGAHPSLPLTLIEQYQIANPGIVVDEIEKVGRSSAGSMHEALLSMLERSTACRWRDQYADAEVDISNVSWIFTANTLEGIPLPLRNRLRVVRMGRPGGWHIPKLASNVMRTVLADRGMDPRWEPELDDMEIKALVRACDNYVSIRDIQRYVEAILDARVKSATRN